MMTVKHITPSGEEFIYPTTHVNYVPSDVFGEGVDLPPNTLWIYPVDHPAQPITGGTVYVMNEHGKTVSRYDIPTQMIPAGLGAQMQPQRPPNPIPSQSLP